MLNAERPHYKKVGVKAVLRGSFSRGVAFAIL